MRLVIGAAAGVALAMVVLTPVSSARQSGKGSITVVITGLRNSDGRVYVSLYDREDGFPKEARAIRKTASLDPEGKREVTAVFEEMGHGEYAIAVLHDEDLNGDMTYRSLHRPKEGYCFSNNLRPKIRAPKWKKARFTLDGEGVTLTLKMIY